MCILSLKEYFFPTFNYGTLGSRAIGTFGHPNYLSLYILLLLPFLTKKKYFSLLLLTIVTLLFTKSLLGITLGVLFL